MLIIIQCWDKNMGKDKFSPVTPQYAGRFFKVLCSPYIPERDAPQVTAETSTACKTGSLGGDPPFQNTLI